MKQSVAATLMPAYPESGIGWTAYRGGTGPGAGKHVVLLAGDEEYRSEEALPMLAKILSQRHGFNCTVLFPTDPDGTINPNQGGSLGKPEVLDSADAIVTSLRFRKWPDAVMKHFDEAMQRGIPIVALRTSTHSFQLPANSAYPQYNRFGKTVLGEGRVTGSTVSKRASRPPTTKAANKCCQSQSCSSATSGMWVKLMRMGAWSRLSWTLPKKTTRRP